MAISPALGVPAQSMSKAEARAQGQAFAEVYDKVAPSVVVLEVATPQEALGDNPMLEFLFGPRRQPMDSPRFEESEGSGFIIREDGYILTNAHVIENADKITARLRDGSRLPLTVVAVDKMTDIALLKADAQGLPAIIWGDSTATRVGEMVAAIGAPYQLDFTLTTGVISAKGRSNLTDTVYEDYLQTDAAISPGNSGGPLCDLEGKVIGINTLISGLNHSIGFAIPSHLAKQVSEALLTSGRVARSWLGIRIETLDEKPALQQMMNFEHGVLVRAIEPDTPAAQSELRPADIIVAVDEKPVTTAREVQQTILGKSIGQKLTLKVWRRGAREGAFLTIPITTAELPNDPTIARKGTYLPTPTEPPKDAALSQKNLGLQFQDIPPEVARQLGVDEIGVIVTNVEPGSSAAVAGIKRRDVITAIGQDVVRDTKSFQEALEKLGAGEALTIQVEREGKKTYAILKR